MLDVLLLQLDMCCKNKIHHGLCLGWCLVSQTPLTRHTNAVSKEQFAVPVKLCDVDFHSPMAAMCRCIERYAGQKGLQARACWA